jgi:hypothetical protein
MRLHSAITPRTSRNKYSYNNSHYPYLAVGGVVALGHQLSLVHARRGRHPQPGGQLALVLRQELAGSYNV